MSIAVCINCSRLFFPNSLNYTWFFSLHTASPIIALPCNFASGKHKPCIAFFAIVVKVSTSVDGASCRPRNSSLTIKCDETYRRNTTTCSLFETSVVSSNINVKNGDSLRWTFISFKTCFVIKLIISFWMVWEV